MAWLKEWSLLAGNRVWVQINFWSLRVKFPYVNWWKGRAIIISKLLMKFTTLFFVTLVCAIWHWICKNFILAKNLQLNFGCTRRHLFRKSGHFFIIKRIWRSICFPKKLFFSIFGNFWPFFMEKKFDIQEKFYCAESFTHFLAEYNRKWLKLIKSFFKKI